MDVPLAAEHAGSRHEARPRRRCRSANLGLARAAALPDAQLETCRAGRSRRIAEDRSDEAPWNYLKAHNLPKPGKKRDILCDSKLKAVMGKDEVAMFEMTGLVGKHLSQV